MADMRKKNMRTCIPSQSTGQHARSNSFTSGEAKDSLHGKNNVTEYKTSGGKNKQGPHGGRNTNT